MNAVQSKDNLLITYLSMIAVKYAINFKKYLVLL